MAKGTIGKVNVKLTANTTAFRKGMRAARRTIGQFGTAVRNIARRVGGFALKIGALVGGGGFALLTKSAFSAGDTLAKTADKLGLTTEALAGLHHAAEVSGVKVRTFDMGLQRMTRRIAEAAVGTGEAKGAIEELGLSAEKLNQMGPSAAFREIADAMMRVQGQGHRVRLAMKLFDSEGVSLVNTLKLGSKGLDEQARMAERLGLTINRIDAKKIENANDAITRARRVSTGLFRQLAVRLAPMVDYVATGFVKWATAGEGAGARIDSILQRIKASIGSVLDVLQHIARGFVIVKGQAAIGAEVIQAAFVKAASVVTDAFAKVFDFFRRGAQAIISGFGALANLDPTGTMGKLVGKAQAGLNLSTIGVQGTQAAMNAALAASRAGVKEALENMKTELAAFDAAGPWSQRMFDWLDGISSKALEAAQGVGAIGAEALGLETALPKAALSTARFAPALAKGGAGALRAQFSASAQSADRRLQTAIEKNTADSVRQQRQTNQHLQDVHNELRAGGQIILSMGGP
jgi:hypothetical protein